MSQQMILKIYEEGVFYNTLSEYNGVQEDEILKIRKNASPTKAEITRYKLWLEQGYISPYTGKTISLSRLFTKDYQIEHIIPQSRYFDDSLSNKVICESAVNEEKDNSTAYEFIKQRGGEIIALGNGKSVELLKIDVYESQCNKYFKKNRTKLKKLLSEDVPEGFIERQINDTRYISKLVKSLLSNIVRQEGEQEATCKNIVPVTGAITNKLKRDWGLNDQWNKIIAPRFKRMNTLTNSQEFHYWDDKINDYRNDVPDEFKKGFSKKRIDHRHHAMDALVIACTTKDHINYITSLNTERKNYSLVSKLRRVEEIVKTDRKTGGKSKLKVAKAYHKPWKDFTIIAKNQLEKVMVSFKQNLRVINKASNKTWQWIENSGQLKKQLVPQTKGDHWAIRKPLHKETVSGKVYLRKDHWVIFNRALENRKLIIDDRIKSQVENVFTQYRNNLADVKNHFKQNPIIINNKKLAKVELYIEATATRIKLSDKFTRKQLDSITDTGIQKILENHIKNYIDEKGKEQFGLAFNPDGLEELNKNIIALNNGKLHQPIRNVRIYEVGSKFKVGHSGNKKDKYVEAAKGTNLFFAVYKGKNRKGEIVRVYDAIPLNIVIERLRQGETSSPEKYFDKDGYEYSLLFSLSPHDLVYVPDEEEIENPHIVNFNNLSAEQVQRVYLFVDGSGTTANFIPAYSATTIFNLSFKEQQKRGLKFPIQNEYGVGSPQSKNQKTLNGFIIKEICWKLKIDRIGNIAKVGEN